jgi:peroxiredoxin family protein
MKKLSIVCFSGEFDRAVAAFTMATGAAAVNYEVNLFFTFWGLDIVKNGKRRRFTGKGILARTFNFLAGGFKNLPMSRLNFAGASPKIMTYLMKKRNVATLDELVQAAISLKVNLYACEMSMNILGITDHDFIPEIKEVLGVVKFLEISRDGETLFI